MPTMPRTASSSSTNIAATISQSLSTTATTSSMILSTAPSINPHRYAIHPHHHPPQNTLQSRTHRHPSMDSQRWNPVLAPLHLPQIWLLQRHKTNEAAGLQRNPAASRCVYIWGEWDWGVYVISNYFMIKPLFHSNYYCIFVSKYLSIQHERFSKICREYWKIHRK